ncbi:MAG TPA: HAD family hydrolase [Balneolales bacterium]|nr:HAD family hydrolase [Balneolales bacterium]
MAAIKNPSFIYFDLDNTLLDHTSAERAAQAETYEHFSFLHDIPLEKWLDTYHEVNVDLWDKYGKHEIERAYLQRHRFEDTLAALGLDTSGWEPVARFYINRYEDYWQWIDGAKTGYELIRKKYPTGILTNGFLELQQKKFKRFGFYEMAKELVISEEVGYMKPQPEIFAHATRRTGLKPEQILYVGDSLTSDIRGGSSYGWKTAWYTPNGIPTQTNEADFVFEDFGKLVEWLIG